MSLPKLELPKFKHHLVGINKTVEYRPYTVREQKILLLAKESKDFDQVVDAMQQIVENCTYDLDVSKLPIFDFEDIFLRIRMKSVSESCELAYKLKETGEIINVDLDLNEVKVQMPKKEVSNTIMITDNIGIQLKYPTVKDLKSKTDDEFIINSIESVFNEDEVFSFSDYSKDEQQEWVDNIDSHTSLKIKEFYDNLPKLKHTLTITGKDGHTASIVLNGLEDFFM